MVSLGSGPSLHRRPGDEEILRTLVATGVTPVVAGVVSNASPNVLVIDAFAKPIR